jgi:hypothetical protein
MSNSLEHRDAIDVRYSRFVGILFAMGSSLNVFINFDVFLQRGNFLAAIIVNTLIFVMGILFLTKIYFSVTRERLYIYNIFSIPIKKYSLASLKDLTIENNKIYLQMHEGRKKLPIAKWTTNQNDWKTLEKTIARQKHIV